MMGYAHMHSCDLYPPDRSQRPLPRPLPSGVPARRHLRQHPPGSRVHFAAKTPTGVRSSRMREKTPSQRVLPSPLGPSQNKGRPGAPHPHRSISRGACKRGVPLLQNKRAIRCRTPAGDGAASQTKASARRNGPSHQWGQARQPLGEPRALDKQAPQRSTGGGTC